MGNEEVELVTVVKPQETRSLLQKFDIPVEHLSYEYVSNCSNVKELERIVRILRSGEEGTFPDLIRHAEKCLAKIGPNSKVLRVEKPALTRSMLEAKDRKLIDDDMEKWMNEMHSREKDLEEGKALSSEVAIPQPDIRQGPETPVKRSSESRVKKQKPKAIASCDYTGWDKFDADAELDRIDLQDEQKQVIARDVQKQQREKYQQAKRVPRENIVNKLSLTATELTVMAEQEKNIGNEAYRAGDYEEALIRYNSSITINSTVNAHNNRAITNIKLQRYQEAVTDCNIVLCMDQNNVTALMRRGLALEHLEKKSEALVDYQTILQIEPNNKIAIGAVNKLRKPSNSKKVRIKIEEENKDTEKSVDLIATSDVDDDSKVDNDSRDSNGISEICFCDRAPGFSQNPKPPPHYKSNYCLSLPGSPPKRKIINPIKSQHSYFSDLKIREFKQENESPRLIIKEVPFNAKYGIPGQNLKLELAGAGEGAFGDERKNNKPTKIEKKVNRKIKVTEKSDVAKAKPKVRIGTPQKKIDVASKYEKPASRAEKSVAKNLEPLESPYEFLHMWQSIKNDVDYSLHAKLLRSLAPEDLDKVIGNKLDGSMFSTILRTLERHFCKPEDVHLTHRFLTALTRLSRFSIVHLFMDSEDKAGLRKILNFVENKKSTVSAAALRQAYEKTLGMSSSSGVYLNHIHRLRNRHGCSIHVDIPTVA